MTSMMHICAGVYVVLILVRSAFITSRRPNGEPHENTSRDITDGDLLDFQYFMTGRTREMQLADLRRWLVFSMASCGVYGVAGAVSRGSGWSEWVPSHQVIAEIRLDDENSYLDDDLGNDDDYVEDGDAYSDYSLPWTPYEEVLRISLEYGDDVDIRYI